MVPDPEHPARPYRQESGAYAGYFLSRTTLEDESRQGTDPRAYVNAATVPYLVFPGHFRKLLGTGDMGDLGLAYDLETGRRRAFIVADVGKSHAPLGEISIALGEALSGRPVNARTGKGVPRGRVAYVIFPGTRNVQPWPRTEDDISKHVSVEIARNGGLSQVLRCVRLKPRKIR